MIVCFSNKHFTRRVDCNTRWVVKLEMPLSLLSHRIHKSALHHSKHLDSVIVFVSNEDVVVGGDGYTMRILELSLVRSFRSK